jgi:hypothetical protein
MKNKNELSIVTYIKTHGLDDAVKTFKLKLRDYPHKVLLKYDQIESNMAFSEVQDCRGLILEKGTWKVLSLAFKKFFNSAESHASKIDWDSAYVYEKCDGSLIQLYWDWVTEKWCAGTTGMAEGEGEVNDKPNTSFSELFWDTISSPKYSFNWGRMVKGRTYMFELMTPYNIVVKPHGVSSVALLGVRDLETLNEHNFNDLLTISSDVGLPLVKTFDMNVSNAGHLIKTFEGMPFSEEGYVVCDNNFNRIKLKNPAYVAAHHLKSKTGFHHIMTIIKTNEIEEYSSTFPERKEEIYMLKENYDKLVLKLENIWLELIPHKPKNTTKGEQKKFAMKVFEVSNKHFSNTRHTGLFFGLKDGKIDTVKDYMFNANDKDLYNILNN